MPLQKGKIDILFRSGMAGDTDERVVPVGAFLDIKNAYVDKKGALSKRNGFQLVSVLKFDAARIDSARGLFSVGDELCIPGDRRLYARDDVSGKWNDRGTISPMMGSTERYFSESSKISAAHTDCSAADGYRAYVTSYLTSDITGIAGATAKVDVRIDSDDGNVVVERTNIRAVAGYPWDATGSGYSCKASFCDSGLLVALFDSATGYDVYKFDTSNLPSSSSFTAVPTASIGFQPASYRVRPDICGHKGASVNGQWSIRYIAAGTFDFVVERYDAAFPAPALQSTATYQGAGLGRTYVDGSISDDPINDRTLVILVWFEGLEPGPIYVDLSSIDNVTGAVLWQTTIDTLTPGDEVVWEAADLVSPDALGVSRGAHENGDEIVAGVFSICKSGSSVDLTDGMGDTAWSSTQHLWDGAEPSAPLVIGYPAYFGHPNYAVRSVGGNHLNPVAPWTNSRFTNLKWMSVRYAAVDATTGGIVNYVATREVKNAALVSKPFYNGRNIYAWAKTNLNIGFGYETSFCLDMRLDAADPPFGGAALQPPYVVAVKDVGTAVTTAQGSGNDSPSPSRHSKGAAQSVDRDSLNRAVVAHRVSTSALTYRHGELLGVTPLGNVNPACIATSLTFGPPVSVATLEDGATVLGGAVVSWYDTARCTELGFVAPPVFDHFWSNCASSSNTFSGAFPIRDWSFVRSVLPVDTLTNTPTPTLTFTYQAMWKSPDAKGYLHRSLISPPYEAPEVDPSVSPWPPTAPDYFVGPAAPNQALDINVTFLKTLPATNRFAEFFSTVSHAGSARVFRDFKNNGLFQEVNSEEEQVFNSADRWYRSFIDHGQDLTVADTSLPVNTDKLTDAGGEILYTISGEIEAVIPEGARLAAYANDRIWLAGFYRAERLAYSKKITPEGANMQKIAPEFNEGFVLIAPAGAAITALSAMDDKVVAFTKDRVYVVAGDGPDATGQNNTFSALTLVSSDSGCIESRSTVSFPGGVMFQGDSGIQLLTRGLSIQFVGQPIRDITKQYPVITSAVNVPEKTQVRFTATTTDGTSGVVIVYDHRVDQWMYWSVESVAVAGIPFVGAAMHKGEYYAVQSDGTLWKEDTATWKDEVDNIYYQMNVKTAWLQAAQQSGWQRVYRATALCENKALMNLQMNVLNDFDSATSQIASWDDTVIATFPELPRMQPMIHIKRQQCQAIQLEISDRTPTAGAGATTGEGFTIAGFSLEVGIKRGMVKVSKQQRS